MQVIENQGRVTRMSIYIALLRGINVGGNKKVNMADLNRTFEGLGFGRVQTYINSGNVLFESENDAGELRLRIEDEIRKDFGFSVTVMLRTAEQLQRILADCPYAEDSVPDGGSIHVSVLNEPLSDKQMKQLAESSNELDEFQMNGQEMYLLYRQPSHESSLTKTLQKFGDSVTTRNMKTMVKLDALAKKMQS